MAIPQNSGSKELSSGTTKEKEVLKVPPTTGGDDAVTSTANTTAGSTGSYEFDDDDDFSTVEANKVEYRVINDLSTGDLLMIRGRPCKIVNMSKAQPGKHGSAKYTIVGSDVFTGARKETVVSSQEKVACPVMRRGEYQILNMDMHYLQLLHSETCELWDDFEVEDKEQLTRIQWYFKEQRQRNACVLLKVVSFGTDAKIVGERLKKLDE